MKFWNIENNVPYEVKAEDWVQPNEESFVVCRNDFGDCVVSTAFLGVSYGDSKPLLFEAMVFGGDHDGLAEKYSSWDEALDGHYKICCLVDKVAINRNKKLNELGI